jgi:CubicO group peptidase (beta-lactamase class C family)
MRHDTITITRRLGLTLFLGTLSLALGCKDEATQSDSDDVQQPVRDARFEPAVEVALQTLKDSQASGVSIAVMERGKFVWVEGFGSASPTRKRAILPDTTFQIGSTTKQLTAMAVLTQVEQGLYELDDTVATVLPAFMLASDPEWSARTTVRDLLSHQSGLVDDLPMEGSSADDGLADYLYSSYAATKWAMNPPGVFWNYSNPNFDLAGLILEEHDPKDRSYVDIISQDIFAPLGMTRSFGRAPDAKRAGNYADSFGSDHSMAHIGKFPDVSFGEPRAQTIDEIADLAVNRPAGGSTFSTPSDMCRWGHFVLHGNDAIVSDATRAELTTATVPTLWSDAAHYGLGMFVWDEFPLSGDPFFATEYYPLEVWEHGGNTLTFTSSLIMVPSQDVVVSILSNGEGTSHAKLQEAILRAVLELPAPVTHTLSVDPSKLAALAGTYFDAHVAGEITIREGGANGLQIAIPAFEKQGVVIAADLVPLSTHTWIAMVGELGGLDLTFVVDAQGKLTPWLRTRVFTAKRVDE